MWMPDIEVSDDRPSQVTIDGAELVNFCKNDELV